MSLEDYLNNRPKPQEIDKTPKGFEPHVTVGSDGLEIVTEAQDATDDDSTEATPDDCRRILQENKLNPDAWILVSYRRSRWQQGDTWKIATKLSAKPSGRAFGVTLPPLDSVVSSMSRVKRSKVPARGNDGLSVVGLLADSQVGKVDRNGGTEELLKRLDRAKDRWFEQIKKDKPDEIILIDAGDPIENEHNTVAQSYTNDLPLTDQLLVWSQIFWEWIELAADNASSVQVISVPSNHGALRSGIGDKSATGIPSTDWGVFIHAQLRDKAKVHPAKYGHVNFYAPDSYDESLNVQSVGGHNIGVVHGHQVVQPVKLDEWWAKQIASYGPTAISHTLAHGHFHSLNVRQGIGGKYIIGAPSSDGGSSWFTNKTGQWSDPGVLSFKVTGADSRPFDWQIL